jgi:hypothetical protein
MQRRTALLVGIGATGLLIIGGAAFFARKKLSNVQPPLNFFRTSCTSGTELDPADREAIAKAANDVLTAMQRGDIETLWNEAHPAMRANAKREQLAQTLAMLSVPLKKVTLPIQPVDVSLVTSSTNAFGLASCRAAAPVGHFIYQSGALGPSPRALVFFVVEEPTRTFSYFLELWKDEGHWRSFYTHLNVKAHKGRTARQFLQAGDEYVAKGNRWMGALLYDAARIFAAFAPAVTTDEQKTVNEKLRPLQADAALKQQLFNWTVDGVTYSVYRTLFVPTDVELAVQFTYGSHRPIGKESSGEEAAKLWQWMKAQHPELSKHFDAVVFEAANADPSKGPMQGYRTPFRF